MSNVRHIIGKKWFIHPDITAIDQDAWSKRGDRAGYWDPDHPQCNYALPPLKEGEIIEQVPAVLLAPLTKAQYAQQHALQLQSGVAVSPLWTEFVLRHGIHDWRGIYEQVEGKEVTEVRPTYEEGPSGRRLTPQSYQDILFFFRNETAVLVNVLMSI